MAQVIKYFSGATSSASTTTVYTAPAGKVAKIIISKLDIAGFGVGFGPNAIPDNGPWSLNGQGVLSSTGPNPVAMVSVGLSPHESYLRRTSDTASWKIESTFFTKSVVITNHNSATITYEFIAIEEDCAN